MGLFSRRKESAPMGQRTIEQKDPMAAHQEGEQAMAQFLEQDLEAGMNLMIPETSARDRAFWSGMKVTLDQFGYTNAAETVDTVIKDIQNESPTEKVDIAARLGDVQRAIQEQQIEQRAA